MGPMLRWFVFTVGMGLLPFGFSILQQGLRGIPPAQWQNSPELFFFSIVVCAAQLDGIFTTLASPRAAWGDLRVERTLLSTMFGLFLLVAIVAAALYGVYVDQARNDPARVAGAACMAVAGRPRLMVPMPDYLREHCTEWLSFQANLFTFSTWVAGAVGVLGTVTEWIRTRRQP